MTSDTDAKTNSDNSEKSDNLTLAKISPKKIKADGAEIRSAAEESKKIEIEKSILSATRLFLRAHGIRKSHAAIRDAIDIVYDQVGPREAVSALSMFGFKASFGSIKIKNLDDDFFPLIAFKSDGNAVVIKNMPIDGFNELF